MAVSQTQDGGDSPTPRSTRVTKFEARSRFIARHFVAWICSMLVLACVVVVTYDVYDVSEAELWELWEPPANFCCCLETSARFAIAVFLPSLVAEYFLIRRLGWRWWGHLPVMPGIYFLAGVVASEIILVMFLGELPHRHNWADRLYYDGVVGLQDLVWGYTYWLVLRGTDWLLPASRWEDSRAPWDYG